MFRFFRRPSPVTAHVNGQAIEVQPGETLLAAALRQGIAFPHSCRVGGCATCKCRLLQGRVRQLTDAAYVLSAEELAGGGILACQSVPLEAVRVQVNLGVEPARELRARVTGLDRLTADILCLRVRPQAPLHYRAGQYALLTLDALPQAPRSYSFASAPGAGDELSFFVREVPGGEFSGQVHRRLAAGDGLSLHGPLGDFWLRPGASPLLMVAGGSGLAPLLAMLQQALADGERRPVTLLFGARREADLYAADELAQLSRDWRAPFDFIPVLSQEDPGSPWPGARGLVSEHIPAVLARDCQAYLCGPPAMVDAAARRLAELGARPERVHADRFTTRHDVVPEPAVQSPLP